MRGVVYPADEIERDKAMFTHSKRTRAERLPYFRREREAPVHPNLARFRAMAAHARVVADMREAGVPEPNMPDGSTRVTVMLPDQPPARVTFDPAPSFPSMPAAPPPLVEEARRAAREREQYEEARRAGLKPVCLTVKLLARLLGKRAPRYA